MPIAYAPLPPIAYLVYRPALRDIALFDIALLRKDRSPLIRYADARRGVGNLGTQYPP